MKDFNIVSKGDFKKYSDIENYFNLNFISDIKEVLGNNKIKWVILEKIHGANFQVYYDETGFHCGKRTSFLSKDINFYNYTDALPDNIENKLKEIFNDIHRPIRLFGELFGGKYIAEHNYKETVKKLCPKCVQKEVQYSPLNHVLFYDVCVNDIFLSWQEVEGFIKFYNLSANDIQFEKPLKIIEATVDDVLKENNAFESRISQVDLDFEHLPVIENNVCEGIVIKPYEREYRTRKFDRIIIKSKNDIFSERKREKKSDRDIENIDIITSVYNSLIPYVNDNRFNAVFSKDIWIKKDLGRFLKAYMEDVFKDAKKDGITIPEDEKILKYVRKKLNTDIIKYKNQFFSRVE